MPMSGRAGSSRYFKGVCNFHVAHQLENTARSDPCGVTESAAGPRSTQSPRAAPAVLVGVGAARAGRSKHGCRYNTCADRGKSIHIRPQPPPKPAPGSPPSIYSHRPSPLAHPPAPSHQSPDSSQPPTTFCKMILPKENNLKGDGVDFASSSPMQGGPAPHATSSSSPIAMHPPPPAANPPASAALPPAYTALPHNTSSSAAPHPATAPTRVPARSPTERQHASSASVPEDEHSAGRTFARGVFLIVMGPLVALLAALYGVGKVIEAMGKALYVFPEATYRSYQAREARKVESRLRRSHNKPHMDV
ncbi:hypothetical protein BC628DRAFT_1422957 [Trametes gibbosa]|nr:hypothetical protein BC628DRAFT_1422957 [Trametes gibbosa]